MKAGPIVLIVWGGLLLFHAAIQLFFNPVTTTLALLGGAGAACVLTGLGLWLLQRRPRAEWRTVPDLSVATMVTALGLAVAVVGAELGSWLAMLGGGIALFGLAGLARERRAQGRP